MIKSQDKTAIDVQTNTKNHGKRNKNKKIDFRLGEADGEERRDLGSMDLLE